MKGRYEDFFYCCLCIFFSYLPIAVAASLCAPLEQEGIKLKKQRKVLEIRNILHWFSFSVLHCIGNGRILESTLAAAKQIFIL